MQKKTKEFRAEIAEQFLTILEENPREWKRPWAADSRPVNAVSNRPYHGINRFKLSCISDLRESEDPRWATFRQIKENGWHLKKGSKGTQVEYWMPVKITVEEDGTTTRENLTWKDFAKLQKLKDEGKLPPNVFFSLSAKYFVVFNGEDIEGLPEREVVVNDIRPDALIEKLSKSMGVEILNDGKDRAFYRPSEDKIHLPLASSFATDYDYSATALHELGHATGHESRLNRRIGLGTAGFEEYAYEELIAELTSCFMSEHIAAPMTESHFDNHKEYLRNWASEIKKDPEFLFSAIKDAEAAADYMEEIIADGEIALDQNKVATLTISGEDEILAATQALSTYPVLTVVYSESPDFTDGQRFDIAEADRLFSEADFRLREEAGYYKTQFKINCVFDGEEFTYEGRYDLGDDAGDLATHIRNFAESATEYPWEDRQTLYEFANFLTAHIKLLDAQQLIDEAYLPEIEAARKSLNEGKAPSEVVQALCEMDIGDAAKEGLASFTDVKPEDNLLQIAAGKPQILSKKDSGIELG